MKKISFGWILLCVFCLILTGFLCVWKNGDVLYAQTGEKPEETVLAFFNYLKEGNTVEAEQLLSSGSTVSLQPENLSEEGLLLLNGLRSSYDCALSGNCEQKGSKAGQTVLLTRLDVSAANAAAVAAAKNNMAYADALRAVLADCSGYMTTDILTVNCSIEDGDWKISPDGALLTALQGGLS